MSSAWIGDGPVTLPPRSLAYTAGVLIVATAIVGVALGFRAAWRAPSEPGSAIDSRAGAAGSGELTAHPIVQPPPPVVAAPDKDAETDAANASIADKAAAAQAVQSKASSPSGNIDEILTSPQEKPPAPVKAPADEAPPTAPVKSDVPF